MRKSRFKPTKWRLYFLAGSMDYAPVVFRECNAAVALATAARAQSMLYRWDGSASCWTIVYTPWEEDGIQEGCGISREPCTMSPRCPRYRRDCLYERTVGYFEAGAGTILLPERMVVDRWDCHSSGKLPPCPLDGYDAYSETDYEELYSLLHEMLEEEDSVH